MKYFSSTLVPFVLYPQELGDGWRGYVERAEDLNFRQYLVAGFCFVLMFALPVLFMVTAPPGQGLLHWTFPLIGLAFCVFIAGSTFWNSRRSRIVGWKPGVKEFVFATRASLDAPMVRAPINQVVLAISPVKLQHSDQWAIPKWTGFAALLCAGDERMPFVCCRTREEVLLHLRRTPDIIQQLPVVEGEEIHAVALINLRSGRSGKQK